jgi:tetratricopeptide (TPR) repeat protein
MRTRFHLCLIGAAFVACLAAPALAQTPPKPGPETPAPDAKGEWVQPPAKLPNVAGDPTRNLDLLFKALKAAPSDEIAKAIEHRIWAVWAVSRSETTNLLMTRVRTAFEKHEVDLALKLLDAIVKIKPDYVEAWNRRATIHFTKKDYGRALADLREVLKREPRHFGALSGLGLILQDVGNDKEALEVYRRVLAIYPRMERVPEIVRKLQDKVEGRDI